MKKYVVRAAKYAVKLVVLLALVFWLMHTSEGSYFASSGEGFWTTFLGSTRGKIFLGAVLVWVVVYPAVEFVRRTMFYSLGTHRKAIVKAMEAGGYELVRETEEEMAFGSRSAFRRILWMGEERLTVTAKDGGIEIEGPRRFAADAVRRIPSYVEDNRE